MRIKYSAPTANHRRVLPNPDPNRVESDPEELVWEASNNFIVDIPDGVARKLLDELPGEFTEASEEEPAQRTLGERSPTPDNTWVEKVQSDEGDDMSTGSPSGSPTTSPRARPTRRP